MQDIVKTNLDILYELLQKNEYLFHQRNFVFLNSK